MDRDENLHTYVKSKIKWGNRQEIFSIFSLENEFSTENVKKGSDVTNRTVERFRLHSWCLHQSKRYFVLYKAKESLFRISF